MKVPVSKAGGPSGPMGSNPILSVMVSVKTLSGSIYQLDREKMRWVRVVSDSLSGSLRTNDGELLVWPEIAIGKPLVLLGPPVIDEADARAIVTSLITEII